MRRRLLKSLAPAVGIGLAAAVLVSPHVAGASVEDSFYRYSGSAPLSAYAPGAVLARRSISYHLSGIALPLTVVQLLYRTTSETGAPEANTTSVIEPPIPLGPATSVVAYQSFYDSLNPADSPSRALAGATNAGGTSFAEEGLLILPELLAGHAVVVADTEGPDADFAAMREYGYATLDSIRAAFKAPAADLASDAKVALLGYSGGGIASEWAAELAPRYAPDVNRRLIGAAMGGLPVDPEHMLSYVDGTKKWSAVTPMAIAGLARAFHLDLTQYLTPAGFAAYNRARDIDINSAFTDLAYSKWSKLVKPQYPTPDSIPGLGSRLATLIMGTGGTPTIPMLVGQGLAGEQEDTPPSPVYGAGDGVMIAGDTRTLVRQYCARGLSVDYNEYPQGSHTSAAIYPWLGQATAWIAAQFAGMRPSNDCASVVVGNSLAPLK